MSLPSWVQIWHPQLRIPGPWDPTLMQRFAAERSAHPSSLPYPDHPRIQSVPPPPVSSPTPSPPPPPSTAASPLPPLASRSPTEIAQTAEIGLQKDDADDHDSHETIAPDHNEASNAVGGSSDSGSEMSLSSIDDAPIIHSSDNAGGSLDNLTSDTYINAHDELLLSPPTFNRIEAQSFHTHPQHRRLSNTVPSTDLGPCDLTSLDVQLTVDALTERISTFTALEELNDTTCEKMAKPPTPSPLRNSVTASQLQNQLDTTDAPVATNSTPVNPSLITTTSARAFHTNTADSQMVASTPDTPALPKINETTQLLSSLTSTSPFTGGSNIHRQGSQSSERDASSVPSQNAESFQSLTPQPFESLSPNPLHNLPPVFQSLWRQANLSLHTSITNIDDVAQRRSEQRRDQAYRDGIEAARPFFREGAKDCMINGNEVVEDPYGERDKDAWQEVYRPGYRPGNEGNK